jgi:hypothetical protein
VHVTRYRLGAHVWYLVTDGMHRAWAAREAGAARLGARVEGEVRCYPEDFQVQRRQGGWELWQVKHLFDRGPSAGRAWDPSWGVCHGVYSRAVCPDWLAMAYALGVGPEADAGTTSGR